MRLWFYALFGRMLYWTRDLDNWQVWVFNHGKGQTGKSTFCGLYQMIYHSSDTEIMGNQIEKMFGLWPLADKFGMVAPEVNMNFSCDQTELQSVITGESISIKGKNLKAVKVTWRVPGMMAGNEIPSWRDTQGAMTRRLVIFQFLHAIKVDSKLDQKLRLLP